MERIDFFPLKKGEFTEFLSKLDFYFKFLHLESIVNRMTEFYFLACTIDPKVKCMDNFFFIYSMFFYNILITKKETTSFIQVTPNFFIC